MKEDIYDAEISPLMVQIIDICKREKIAMLATFCLDGEPGEELLCSTALMDPNDGFKYPPKWRIAKDVILGARQTTRLRTLDKTGRVIAEEIIIS